MNPMRFIEGDPKRISGCLFYLRETGKAVGNASRVRKRATNMLKAVIFDMDGVIIDSQPTLFKVEKDLFKDLGISISEEEHHSFVGATSKAIWSHIKNKYKLEQTVEKLVEMGKNRYTNYLLSQKDERPIPGVVELIEELYSNNLKLVLASSSLSESIEIVLGMFELERYFKAIVNGEDVNNGKPAPDIFLYAAELLKVKPPECIVIEDSKNGVEAAKSAGMKCIGFKNPNSGNQDLSSADIVVDNLLTEINYKKMCSIYDNPG